MGEAPAIASALEDAAETPSARALMQAGRALVEGEAARALALLEAHFAEDANDARFLPLRLAAWMGLRRFDKAMQDIFSLLELIPNSQLARSAALTALRQLHQRARHGDEHAQSIIERACQFPALAAVATRLRTV